MAEHSFKPRRPDVANVQPITWAWERRLPLGALSLLVGEEGAGKGTMLAWLIARLTRGELPGDLQGTPANVLIVGDEDGFDEVWTPRLLAAGAVLENVRDLPPSDELGLLDVKRDVEALREIVREGAFRVVVFDALLDNLPAATDDWKPRSVRAALRPLGRLAREEGFAAFGSLHTIKGAGASFREKMSGSHAFNALARSGLLLAQHPQDRERRVLTRGKGNLSRRPPAIEFTIASELVEANGHRLNVPLASGFAESGLTVEDVLAGSERSDEAFARSEACDFLRAVLAEGPVPTGDVLARASEAGISGATLRRARGDLRVQACQRNRQWLMALPDETVSESERLSLPESSGAQALTGAHRCSGSDGEQLNGGRPSDERARGAS